MNLKTKKEEIILVQGALRECGFCYEYVFPEECLREVLTMLDIKNCQQNQIGKMRTFALRKMLGKDVKPIPEYKEIPNKWVTLKEENIYLTTQRFVDKRGLAIYPIGIRKDVRQEAQWGYEQEML